MYMLAINHDIEDYDKWKSVFDRFPKDGMGLAFHRVNRNVDDPHNITVVHGFESAEDARAFRDDPALKEAMGEAGATNPPRIELFEEVEAVQH